MWKRLVKKILPGKSCCKYLYINLRNVIHKNKNWAKKKSNWYLLNYIYGGEEPGIGIKVIHRILIFIISTQEEQRTELGQ